MPLQRSLMHIGIFTHTTYEVTLSSVRPHMQFQFRVHTEAFITNSALIFLRVKPRRMFRQCSACGERVFANVALKTLRNSMNSLQMDHLCIVLFESFRTMRTVLHLYPIFAFMNDVSMILQLALFEEGFIADFAVESLLQMHLFMHYQKQLVLETGTAALADHFPDVNIHVRVQNGETVEDFVAQVTGEHTVDKSQVVLCHAVRRLREYLIVFVD